MKRLIFAITAATLSIVFNAPASAQRKVCNHDPVCQAERDGVSVAEAQRRDRASAKCFSSAGVTEEAWRAYKVDSSRAPGIRACLARVQSR
jgi:hypothetical protein